MKIALPIGIGKTQYQINIAYINYVAMAGYTPVLVTPDNDVTEMTNLCDGLFLPGGIDIDPIYYGEDNAASFDTDVEKDDFERSLFAAFIEAKKPIFGVCRGFQLMARESLLLHVPTSSAKKSAKRLVAYKQDIGSHAQTNLSVAREQPSHFVLADMAALYGQETEGMRKIPVNSMHHQALCAELNLEDLTTARTLGYIQILALTARGISTDSAKKGGVVVEAAQFNNWEGVKVVGVQWHPEELEDVALLHQFFGKPQGSEEDAGKDV